MSIPDTELAPRLIRLFYAGGLISQPEFEAYGSDHKRHKPILDVLTQPVSLDSFKDLLNAEITLKSGQSQAGGAESALHRELSTTAIVQDAELAQLLAAWKRPAASLLSPLQRDGMLSEAQITAILDQAGRADGPDASWLVASGHLTADQVSRWLAGLQSSAVRQMALFSAIYLARHNRLIDDPRESALLALLSEYDRREVRRQLAEETGLTSTRLCAAIEKGLDLPQLQLDAVQPDAALIAQFPQGLIRRHMILPLRREGNLLFFATSDPFNLSLLAFLHWITGVWPAPVFSTGQAIIKALNALGGTPEAEDRAQPNLPPMLPETAPAPAADPVAAKGAKADKGRGKAKAAPAVATAPASTQQISSGPQRSRSMFDGELLADNASAVQLVSSLVENAIELRTTDIHIEPVREGLVVRFRIDGDLHRIMNVPGALGQAVVSRIKVLANLDVTERRKPQDGHFELKMDRNSFDFRVSTLPALLGEKLVIRILDTAQVKTSLEDLGLLPKQRTAMEWMLDRPHGLILVTGPTGSGKTSTLYAGMHRLNSEQRNLVTIEDPVEYQLPGITQVQVDAHNGMTFSDGLRSILRQDPDIIMVGEIRDIDTARIAVRAATTGHLVLSTLHTNSALGAIDALVNLGIAPFILGNSIAGIISQRLVRRLCPHCRKAGKLTDDLAVQLGLEPGTRKKVYRATGCPECLGSGYFGRSGVFEVVRVIEALRLLISSHAHMDRLEECAREHGMISLLQAGAEKVLAGETSPEEVMRKIMLDA